MDPRSPLYVNWQSPVRWEHPLNRGLVAWWKVVPYWKGGTVFRDLCGRNHGTLTNMDQATDWVSQTHQGGWGALDFLTGSSQYISTSVQLQSVSPDQGTICWWFLPTLAFNDGTIHALWGQNQRSGAIQPACDAQKYLDNNIYIGWNDSGNDDRVILAASSSNYTQNEWQWYCYKWVKDGLSELYRNGAVLGSVSVTNTHSPAGSFRVSNYGSGAVESYFTGQQDSYRIYNRALSAAEVQALYLDELHYCRETLRRWWAGSVKAPAAANVYGTVFQSPVVRSTPRYAM